MRKMRKGGVQVRKHSTSPSSCREKSMRKKEDKVMVLISFNQKQYEKLGKACEMTSLKEPVVIRFLLKEKFKKLKDENTITFTFDLTQNIGELEVFKRKTYEIDKMEQKKIKRISQITKMSSSFIILYLIEPELDQIIESEGILL